MTNHSKQLITLAIAAKYWNPIIGLWLCHSTSLSVSPCQPNNSLPQSNQFGCCSQNWLHPPPLSPISQPSAHSWACWKALIKLYPIVHVSSKCAQPIKMHTHQSTSLPQIFFSLYHLDQSFNSLLPTKSLIIIFISYPMIYISFQTTHNSMSNSLFNAFSCFAYNTPTTTAINMFLPPFESSH